MEVSIKTRIGVQDPLEFESLLPVFRKFPLKELIVHPRVQKEMYKGTPHKEIFEAAMAAKEFPVCYNGDIFGKADYEQLMQQFPTLDRIMIGRGLLQNPGLAREIQGGAPLSKEEAKAYEKYDEMFKSALADNLNTSNAITVLYDVLKSDTNNSTKLALIESFDKVLSLNLIKKEETIDKEKEKVNILKELTKENAKLTEAQKTTLS